ncbi:unnamed protein product, partial [Mesorhabditis spiculigera]
MVEKNEKNDLYDEIQLTGLKYLKEKNVAVRCIWGAVVVLFIALTIYQIQSQLADFLEYPVVTNIEAEYPEKIFFPAIAICNNNQYSLGYLATEDILERFPEERDIEFGWPLFKTVLVYNQTEIPVSTASGISVAPGQSTNIPLKIVHRTKLPGTGCRVETQESLDASNDYFNGNNIRSCHGRIYHQEFERSCNCTFRHLYTGLDVIPEGDICDVEQYFTCILYVQENIAALTENRTKTECRPTCEQVEFLAQQDTSELPKNLMPLDSLIDTKIFDKRITTTQQRLVGVGPDGKRIFKEEPVDCEKSGFLTTEQVGETLRARMDDVMEKRSRYDDVEQREFKHLADNFYEAKNNLKKLGFPLRNPNDTDPNDSRYDRTDFGTSVLDAVRARIVDETPLALLKGKELKERLEARVAGKRAGPDPVCMEWVLHGWDDGRLNGTQGRALLLTNFCSNKATTSLFWWLGEATKDQFALLVDAVNLDYLFDNKFPKHWRQPIDKLLDDAWMALIHDIDAISDAMQEAHSNNDSLFSNGTMDEVAAKNQDCFVKLISAFDNLRAGLEYNYLDYLKSFHVAFSDHLKRYHNKFKLDDEFKKQNMAVVNIYIRSNTIEKWTQKWQYTFWSLACDVGGALGLFIGVSVASLLEIFYVLYRHLQQRKRRKQYESKHEMELNKLEKE